MRRGEGAGMLFLFDAVPYREWQVNRFTTPLRASLEELRTITDGISSPFVDYLHPAPVTAAEVPHVARIAYAHGMAGLVVQDAHSVSVRGRSPTWLKVTNKLPRARLNVHNIRRPSAR